MFSPRVVRVTESKQCRGTYPRLDKPIYRLDSYRSAQSSKCTSSRPLLLSTFTLDFGSVRNHVQEIFVSLHAHGSVCDKL